MFTHFLAIVPIVSKLLQGRIWDALGIGTVFCTSVNYWRKPEKGLRRNMDMAAVFSVGAYNMYKCPSLWLVTSPLCLIIWILSNRYNDDRIHSLIHIIPIFVYMIE